MFDPVDFISKLAALVPKPRVNLTRYYGVLAPNSKSRIKITPAKRGKGGKKKKSKPDQLSEQSTVKQSISQAVSEHHKSMTWAQRLKRVFNIDMTVCNRCGGKAKIIACIEDPLIIKKILDHLDVKAGGQAAGNQRPEPQGSPV